MKRFSIVVLLLCSFLFFAGHTDAQAASQLLIINKKVNQLAYYNDGSLVQTFSVATGRNDSLTPEGKFKIVSKIVNRPYYSGGIPGGDPRNPLGDRWMGLDARGTYGTTYAIHGNNNEDSIGKYVSSGCIRMHNNEVRWLYDQVAMYTPVIIANTNDSFQAIAAANGYYVNQNGWVASGGNWYYYVNGTKKTGWLLDKGSWYYLDGSGVMKTGWVASGGNWYYLGSSGAMKTGWVLDGDAWYYLDSSGAMKTGWILDKGQWYYLDSSGAMKTGWLAENGKWYYLSSSGAMKTGWLADGGKWYYLSANGAMAVNTTVDGYKIGADGAWIQVQYVALGDSFAAGQTADGRQGNGYPYFLSEQIQKVYQLISYQNLGTAGYTAAQLKQDVRYNEAVKQKIKQAGYITIDVGIQELQAALQTNTGNTAQTIQDVGAYVHDALQGIYSLNPKAKVFVMGYHNVFVYASGDKQAASVQALHQLNAKLEETAGKNNQSFIGTEAVIARNYAAYMPNRNSIYLSQAGYSAVADAFWEKLKNR